jgi:hypothetical protein
MDINSNHTTKGRRPSTNGTGKAPHDPITQPRTESERLLREEYLRRQKAEAETEKATEKVLQAASILTGSCAHNIICKYFMEVYRPAFRRGTTIYSESLRRDVKPSEACYSADRFLIQQLSLATDAKRRDDGSADVSALPALFWKWAKVAWQTMVGGLPDEEESEEISTSAEEEFQAKVRATLLHLEAIGYRRNGDQGEQEVQRRSLIDWCNLFAKPGRWQSVRPYTNLLWTRRGDDDSLQVALRADLFRQIPGCAELARLKQSAFSDLCERYGIGDSIRAGGERAVVLSTRFLAGIFAQPSVDDSVASKNQVDDSVDVSGSLACVRTREENPELSTETSTKEFHHRRKGERPGEDDE